jgi:putative Holliday junction resolvase
MKILGIDYGTKRIGVAISDETRGFAIPVCVVKNTTTATHGADEALKEVIELAAKNSVTEVVMGESRDYDQKENSVYAESMTFKKQLEDAGLTVYLELEFMTSVQAERFQGKTDMSDASAAALILQSYLDKLKV